MPERLTGTVTFLFSDIEGSTRLRQQLRDPYDDVLSTQLKAAAKLSGARRYRAYSQLALELERDGAPAAATNASRDFFSSRIGCQVYQPLYGMDIAARPLPAAIIRALTVLFPDRSRARGSSGDENAERALCCRG